MNRLLKKTVSAICIMLLGMTVLFTSYSESVYAENETSEQQSSALEQNEKSMLLYGYNVTSGRSIWEPDALQTRKPIIDKNSDYLNQVELFDGKSKQSSNSYVGTSLKQVSEEFAFEVSNNIFGRIYMVDVDLGNLFNIGARIDNAYSEKYELYSMYITRRYYIAQLEPEEIKKYLDDEFKKELYAVKSESDALKLFSTYGTHLNTGYMYGGRMNISNYMTTSETSRELTQGMSLSEKISAVVGKISAGQSASITEQFMYTESDATTTSDYSFESFGGEATSSLTLDGLFTYNQSLVDGNNAGFMYTRWVNSINQDKDLAIIGIPNGAQSVPLWDLLDNSNEATKIRKVLIDAYVKACGDNYEKFLADYPELTRRVYDDSEDDTGIPDVVGVYIRTLQDYFYHVDASDLQNGGNHYELHTGDRFYLEFDEDIDTEYEYELQNCELVDKKAMCYQVNGTSGNVVINVKSKDAEKPIISVPLKSCDYEGGAGTDEYPFIVTNPEQFCNISAHSSSCFILQEDIDFGGKEISSLGNFSGVLDGNYCTISNFKIAKNSKWGIFEENSGTIKNLSVKTAGTSTSNTDFAAGGCNYGSDYAKDNFTKNSTASSYAGMICARNLDKGTIENCEVSECYIRNILKDNAKTAIDSQITVSTGGLVGYNAGTISKCLVNNTRVLSALVYTKDKNKEYSENIYAGGLIGELFSGSVKSCVADISGNASVMAFSANDYKNEIKCPLHTYAGGFAGCCTGNATLGNSYAYIRKSANNAEYIAVDAENIFTSKTLMVTNAPKEYFSLRSVWMGLNENPQYTTDNLFAFSADTNLQDFVISTNGKNGTNHDSSTNVYTANEGVTEKEIKDNTSFNGIGFDSFSIRFDKDGASHIKHVLSDEKNSYMTIQRDVSSNFANSYIDGDIFNPVGLKLERSFTGKDDSEYLNIFNIQVLDNNSTDSIDQALDSSNSGEYRVVATIYDEAVKADEYKVTVGKNGVSKVYIDEPEDGIEIYFDQIDNYFDNWNKDSVTFIAKMANGDSVTVTPDSEYFSKIKASLKTEKSKVIAGDNLVYVDWELDGKRGTTTYIIEVNKRDISSIVITKEPKKKEYNVGEKVNLDGIEIKVNYSEGDSSVLSGREITDKIEVIGDLVAKGDNEVIVSYDGYSLTDSFTVTGSGKPISSGDGSITSGKFTIKPIFIIVAVVVVAVIVIVIVVIAAGKKKKGVNEIENTEQNDKKDN